MVEEAHDGEPPLHYVERIARTKATVGWKRMEERLLPPRPVLGADTEVVLDDVIFGKPADIDAARQMIAKLSGRRHDVITAVALRWQDDVEVALSVSHVTLRRLTAGRDRALRRHRRAVRQGRRLRDPGPGRRVHHAPRRQLLGRHGTAAGRDGGASRADRPPVL